MWLTGLLLATVAVGSAGAAPRPIRREPQPSMRNAQEHLRAAQRDLRNGTPDKGGHRVKAMRLVDQALAEVQRAIAFDNRH